MFLSVPRAGLAEQATSSSATAGTTSGGDLDEIVVNGIKRGELILPTTVKSTSAYGLDLGVMETPRNNTLLSKAQLDALNVQNPSGFSYLTSSSYTDAAFGQPAIPRIRGQYADLFLNGMRESYSDNGYGAPVSFNSADSIDIVKGPASVQAGPGAGVGGSIDITTKMPTFAKATGSFNLEFDSQQKRRASFDVNTPVTSNTAVRVSFTSDDSGSYYHDMFFHQQSLYAAVLTEFTPKYSVLITGSFEDSRYRENDGVNRVNQGLIDNGTYLTGTSVGPIQGFGSAVNLTGTSSLSDKILIDEPGGTGAHSHHIKGQVIQTFNATDDFSIVNNTFYDYMDRYNEVQDYYADTCMGCYTVENKTDFKLKFATSGLSHDIDAGFTYRYAHVMSIQNYANEPVSVFDLTQSPSTWVFPPSAQAGGGAVQYTAAFNRVQWGVPGRDAFFPNGSIDSNLQDAAIFLEHRIKFSPQWSVLYGLRGDVVQLNQADPLGTPGSGLVNGYPQTLYTNWYGLYNGNVSVVYSPSSHISAYLTYNKAQYVDPNANDGAIGVYGVDPTTQLRQNTLLEEAGMKFDLLDKALFISTAIFKQERAVPSGPGGLRHSFAHIRGAEIELNYQPDPHFFATASYSYLHTTLDTAQSFYNFPAMPGINYDGAGTNAVFKPGQTLLDPGVPQHLFNVLVNYKHDSGLGVQANIQVTGPIETTQSGYLDMAATTAASQYPGLPAALVASLNASGGYYKSPQIPWQYTLNTAVFYNFLQHYSVKFEVYNLTDRHNLVNDYPFYGNDFLTRVPPRSYDLTFTGKF
ncbi:MAG: TonB-dependent receptor [Gammaproteobacteria bacterium]|nr:TonB-dependent receptor [Gammaproteobacteria bacterium]